MKPARQPARRAALAVALLLASSASFAADGRFFSGEGDKPAAGPATLATLEAAEAALADVWSRVPFTTRRVMFVTRPAAVYGDYAKRATAVFAPGEKLLTYLEPVGYGYAAADDGAVRFSLGTDFELLTRDGKVLGGQKALQHTEMVSRYRDRELMMNLTLTMDAVPAGDYVLAYIFHDEVSGKQARVELPFTVKPAP